MRTAPFFDEVAEAYDSVLGRTLDEVRGRLLGVIPKDLAVLDLGIGTGRELVVLDELNCAVTGIDSSSLMLAQADARGRAKRLILGDIWGTWDVEDHTFDAVIALHGTLAHPPDAGMHHLRDLAKECARVLKPDGFVYFEVPTANALQTFSSDEYPISMESLDERTAECTNTKTGAKLLAVSWPETIWRSAMSPWLTVDFADSVFELCIIGSVRETA